MRHINYGIDPKHALSVLSTNLFPDPDFFIRELVSNAIDATSPDAPAKRRRVDVSVREEGTLTVRDHGCGMTEDTMEQVLPVFFKTTKSMKDPDKIGRFGIGLYASLCYARELIIRSRFDGTPSATKAVFGSSGISLEPVPWEGPGTEVAVHLSNDAPESARDVVKLALLLQSVFPFSPVDIYLNGVLVAGPSRYDPPWEDSQRSEGWSPFPAPNKSDPPPPEIIHVIRKRGEIGGFALFLTGEPIPRNLQGLGLFVRRVRVSSFYLPMGNPFVPTFVAGVINAQQVELALARDSVRKDHRSVWELDRLFFSVLGDGLQHWAEESPKAFSRFMDEHRGQILAACSMNDDLRHRIQSHIRFQTPFGHWKPLSVAQEHGCGFYAYHARQLAGLSSESNLPGPVFLFESAAEHAFLRCLRAGSLRGVEWKRIDEVYISPPGGQLFFRAQQAKAALDALWQTTKSRGLVKEALGSALKAVRSKVSDVVVVDLPRDNRAAWLFPRLKPGVSEEENQREAHEKVIREGRIAASHPYFEIEVRRTANEDGCNKTLYLNYAHPLVSALFRVIGSPREYDQQVAGFLLGGVLALARNESFDDWTIWNSDFRDNADQIMNLIALILDSHESENTTERRHPDED